MTRYEADGCAALILLVSKVGYHLLLIAAALKILGVF